MRTWTLIFSIVSTVITLVLAVLGYWTLEVSTRAWVGPVKGTALIDDTGTVTFKITYKNSGKEPAVQFGDDWADDWSAISEDSSAKFDFYSNCKSDGGLGRCSERAARGSERTVILSRHFKTGSRFPISHTPTQRTGCAWIRLITIALWWCRAASSTNATSHL
jgi:hypothetical protein